MTAAPTKRTMAAGASILALASLTACGAIGDLMPGTDPFLEQSARSIADAAFADMQDVSSMRILGDVDSAKYGRMRVDIRVGDDGCVGSLEIDHGGGVQLRQNEEGSWFRADERFWRAEMNTRERGSRLWRTVRGKWFVADGKDDHLSLCDLDKLLGQLNVVPDKTNESFDAEDVVAVGDSGAVPLTGGRGRKRSTIWVSVQAPHYVLKTTPATDNGLPETLYFEEFGAKVIAESPDKKDIVTLTRG